MKAKVSEVIVPVILILLFVCLFVPDLLCCTSLQDFPWHPKPIEELTPLTSVQLNENMCVIYFSGQSSWCNLRVNI